MPDGIILLDSNSRSSGPRATRQWSAMGGGRGLLRRSRQSEIPVLTSAFHGLATGAPSTSTLRAATTISRRAGPRGRRAFRHLIVTVRDVTLEIHQQQKLAAIHQAGMELADLTADVVDVVEERSAAQGQHPAFHRDLLDFGCEIASSIPG